MTHTIAATASRGSAARASACSAAAVPSASAPSAQTAFFSAKLRGGSYHDSGRTS
ncbi:MAG: hypothetical protein U0168_17840 [Nannocystaceae bacterium]